MSDFNNPNNKRIDDFSRVKRHHNIGVVGMESAREPLWFIRSRKVINYVLGVIEVLLLFRLAFKLLGANPGSAFVTFLYSVTRIFTAPFSGIFKSLVTNGFTAKSVFEPATIIGMIVYAVAAWGLVSLLRIKVDRDGY